VSVAVLIMCNYFLVITWFPAVIVMHHQCSCAKRCERRCCCCLQAPLQTIATSTLGAASPEMAPSIVDKAGAENLPTDSSIGRDNARCLERFLSGPVHKVVTHAHGGPVLAVVLGCAAIGLGVIGATIERSSATMLLLQESHICSQYQLKVTSFSSTPGGRSEFVAVDLLFGVEPVDTGDHNDPESDGEIALDNSFDIADPAAQEYLLGLGAATRSLSAIESNWLTDIERFDEWLRAGSAAHCPTGIDGLPLPRSEFLTCLKLWFDGSGRYDRCDDNYGGCGSELRFQDDDEQPVVWKTRFRTNTEVQDEWDYGKHRSFVFPEIVFS
jgi:hypothetical protein